MPFTGVPSLLYLDVQSEVEPPETTSPVTYLNVGWVTIGSGYDVISDEVAELGAEGAVRGSAPLGLPYERRLRHSSLHQSERARFRSPPVVAPAKPTSNE